ncbi:Hypothetical protein CAP_2749 [Chondromyces apiculatus DSM 436]|uniref:Uncharacterized protein n=1 Tax=Chondromyces apiculatus DSM 436 TaxID=1192034 RepID=A0A017THY1_9BACT|nr:Hypothetical protein CAP_2749 [Chondromyces apiculatus DSM 436]
MVAVPVRRSSRRTSGKVAGGEKGGSAASAGEEELQRVPETFAPRSTPPDAAAHQCGGAGIPA